METAAAPEAEEMAPEGAIPEAEAAEEDVDPAIELAARFDEIEATLERLKGLDPNAVRSALGRIPSLQSGLDEVSKRNPLADIDPRLEANEAMLTSIADALIASDLTDDRMKAALGGARANLNAASGQRAQRRMREELKGEILSALPQSETRQVADPATEVWAQATADVVAELSERLPDFDPKTIPATVWDAGRAKGTPARAVAHVLRWAEQQEQAPAAERAATRRQAAGGGSPARSGGAALLEQDKKRLMDEGIPITDAAARKRVAESLGITLD